MRTCSPLCGCSVGGETLKSGPWGEMRLQETLTGWGVKGCLSHTCDCNVNPGSLASRLLRLRLSSNLALTCWDQCASQRLRLLSATVCVCVCVITQRSSDLSSRRLTAWLNTINLLRGSNSDSTLSRSFSPRTSFSRVRHPSPLHSWCTASYLSPN